MRSTGWKWKYFLKLLCSEVVCFQARYSMNLGKLIGRGILAHWVRSVCPVVPWRPRLHVDSSPLGLCRRKLSAVIHWVQRILWFWSHCWQKMLGGIAFCMGTRAHKGVWHQPCFLPAYCLASLPRRCPASLLCFYAAPCPDLFPCAIYLPHLPESWQMIFPGATFLIDPMILFLTYLPTVMLLTLSTLFSTGPEATVLAQLPYFGDLLLPSPTTRKFIIVSGNWFILQGRLEIPKAPVVTWACW